MGRPSSQSARPSSVSARVISSRVAEGRPKRMLSSSVESNRNPSCGTMTIRSRSEEKLTVRRSVPSTRIRPEVGSMSRVSSLAKVVLPEPVSPTTAIRVRGGISTDTSWSTGGPPG